MSEVAPGSAVPSRIALVAVLVVLAAAVAYSFHAHNVARDLAAQNSQVTASLAATQGQIQALTTKLDALTAAQEKPAPSHHVATTRGDGKTVSHRRGSTDPRWRHMQSQLDEQGKQITSTQQDLANTRTELQGSIAKTHDELVVLEKRGERSYYEFDLDKSGQFQREGPVGVRLRKANTKHEYADLELMVDDFKLTKKHVNVYEPVAFYAGDNGRPVELVINSISKNHIHGYVSEPKYKNGELEAMAGGSQAGSTAPAPPQRQKLTLPGNEPK